MVVVDFDGIADAPDGFGGGFDLPQFAVLHPHADLIGDLTAPSQKVLDNGAQLILKGAWQRTPNRLLVLDGMAIGGVNTVRGYRENRLVRDTGDVCTVEFDYPVLRGSRTEVSVSLIPFYDFGRGRNNGESATRLSSVGMATRARWQGLPAVAKIIAL